MASLLVAALAISALACSALTGVEAAVVGGIVDSSNKIARRSLAETQATCAWDSWNTGCYLSNGYVTTFTSSPSTESQKLLARVDALSTVCEKYNDNSTGCDLNTYCAYDSIKGLCLVNNAYINVGWLRGITYCAGSYADLSLTCETITNSTTCAANSKCSWVAYSSSSINLAALYMDIVSNWASAGISKSTTGVCWPKWVTDTTTVANLLTGTSTEGNVMGKLVGTCSASTMLTGLYTTCALLTTQSTCTAAVGCEWSLGSCGVAENLGFQLLLNASDPWVKSYRQAAVTCAGFTASDTCEENSGIFTTPATTTIANYAALNPTFPIQDPGNSATGVAPMASLLVSMIVALVCLWTFMA